MAATGQDSGVLELNLKIIQSIELGTTKDYEVELDEDGGFIQIISTGRGSTWTAWTGEADREFTGGVQQPQDGAVSLSKRGNGQAHHEVH